MVDLHDSMDIILNLLENLPNYFKTTNIIDNCFVAALQAANHITKHIGGKMIFFQVSSTIINHPLLGPKGPPTTVERLDLVNSTNAYFANTGSELAHT